MLKPSHGKKCFHRGFDAPTSSQCNKAENALKGKLRRLCAPKMDGTLKVPQWLHDEWRNSDHLQLAKQFEACNFDKVSPKFVPRVFFKPTVNS